MEKLNHIIAENLKRLRDEKKFSLDNVSKLSGVSKSMLGQIERGEVNPTISTVWKISNGLKISFTSLMSRPESDIELVNKKELEVLLDDQGKVRNYPVFPFDPVKRFEMYTVEIDEGGILEAEAHPRNSQEFITVFNGELTIRLNNEEYKVACGDSIRFKADAAHTYLNLSSGLATLSMIIYYPQ